MDGLIRKATKEDIPRIKEIRFSVRENRMADPASVTDRDIEWFIDKAPIWIWEIDGNPMGFSAGDPRDGSVWALFVDPKAERKGGGRALFDRCCESLKQAGWNELTLCTGIGTRAENFYRSRGWNDRGTNKKGEIILGKVL